MSSQNPNQPSDELFAAELEALSDKTTRITAKTVARFALMFAVILVAMTLDRMFSAFLLISFAIISVSSCISLAIVKNKWPYAFAAGLFFGIASLITAFIFARTAFYNPLISVIPRMFVGLSAFAAYKLMLFALHGMQSRRTAHLIAAAVGAIVGVFTNTLLVLLALQLFKDGDKLFVAFQAIALTNFLPELIIATVLVPPLVIGVRRGLNLDIDGKSAETDY